MLVRTIVRDGGLLEARKKEKLLTRYIYILSVPAPYSNLDFFCTQARLLQLNWNTPNVPLVGP